ncbi:HNH endonuclease [Paeniglutamicibacter sp. ABSL32-1]|uniref:HNH endonuclease signature motif containing protein n=1 Tax=Paeniglutamicibacter quisquiliarum TaxID=2849498 RepID=UPI001C2DEBC7|nr:HNH endonuclease signature motif containing protein [Paeniglutamicibacter quisquiliarum]MBV1780510.1 HNH endonuclease [Paeniglutamicibacter quisquiliarum]
MDTQELIEALTGDGGDPGHTVSPVEKLRLLHALSRRADELAGQLSTEISSPTQAALLAHTVERTHRQTEFSQIRAAHTAQRTLVQDLPAQNLEQVRAIAEDPDAFIRSRTALLADPATVPSGLMPFKDTTAFLQGALGLGHFAARDRLHAANSLLPRTDIHGNACGPRYPKLAEQVHAGAARLGAATAAARKLDKLAPSIAAHPEMPDLAGRLEEQVAQSVAAGIPRATNSLFDALADELDNATEQEPSPDEIRAKTGIFVTKRTRHYTWMSMCMLNADAEVFLSHFAASGNPRTLAGNREALASAATGMTPAAGTMADANGATTGGNAAETPDGPDWFTRPANTENDFLEAPAPGPGDPLNGTVPGADGLTPPQRHLQTLLNLMRAPNKPPGKGTTGLPSAQLVIHCRLDTLLGLAKGAGWSAHGLEIPIGEVRRRLATDGVIPLVLGGQSEILDLGQEMRLAPDYMRRAILARDGGCFYPGCTVPPELLEMCHIDGYAQGGRTSVGRMTGGCSCHHHMADNGLLTLLVHNGLPHVILPKHLDPEQLPRRNAFWQRPEATLF